MLSIYLEVVIFFVSGMLEDLTMALLVQSCLVTGFRYPKHYLCGISSTDVMADWMLHEFSTTSILEVSDFKRVHISHVFK